MAKQPKTSLLETAKLLTARWDGPASRAKPTAEDVAELAADIKANGLINPITVNDARGQLEVICGCRRIAACDSLGWKTIPARVYDKLPADVVASMRLAENLQRKDLNPISEAEAFTDLIDKLADKEKTLTEAAQIVADRVSKSLSFVRGRLDLLRLCADVRKHVASGRLPVAHARVIARAGSPKGQRDMLSSTIGQPFGAEGQPTDYLMPLYKLRDHLGYILQALGGAGWPMDKRYAGKPPCHGCSNNTATEPELFEGVHLPGKSPKGNCTDKRGCFEKKAKAWAQEDVARKKAIAAERKKKGLPTVEKKKRKPADKTRRTESTAPPFPNTPAEVYVSDTAKWYQGLFDQMKDHILHAQGSKADEVLCDILILLFANRWSVSVSTLNESKATYAAAAKMFANKEPSYVPCKQVVELLHAAAFDDFPQNIGRFCVPFDRCVEPLLDATLALANRWGVKNIAKRPARPRKKTAKKKTKGKTKMKTKKTAKKKTKK